MKKVKRLAISMIPIAILSFPLISLVSCSQHSSSDDLPSQPNEPEKPNDNQNNSGNNGGNNSDNNTDGDINNGNDNNNHGNDNHPSEQTNKIIVDYQVSNDILTLNESFQLIITANQTFPSNVKLLALNEDKKVINFTNEMILNDQKIVLNLKNNFFISPIKLKFYVELANFNGEIVKNDGITVTWISNLNLNYIGNQNIELNNQLIVKACVESQDLHQTLIPQWSLIDLKQGQKIDLNSSLVTTKQLNEFEYSIEFQKNFFKNSGNYQLQFQLLNNAQINVLEQKNFNFEVNSPIIPEVPPIPIDDNFLIPTNDGLDLEYYKNNAQTLYQELIVDLQNTQRDYLAIAKKFAQFLSNLATLVTYQIIPIGQEINLNDLHLTLNETAKIMISLESKYYNLIGNFSLLEHLTFVFDNQNQLTSILFKTIPKEYSSRAYQILMSNFIRDCLSNVDDKMSDFEKIVAVSQYICNFLVYAPRTDWNQDLYYALNTKIGVCRHYASLLAIMLNVLNINNYLSIGILHGNGPIGSHVWNMVEINQQWYALDLTSLDAYFNQYTPTNCSGNSMKFNPSYFLTGSDDNKYWQYRNIPFDAITPNSTSPGNNINKYQNENASFMFHQLWSKQSYQNYFSSTFQAQSNFSNIHYWNGKWYFFIKDSSGTNLKQYDYKTNTCVVLAKISAKFQTIISSSIGYNNYMFLVCQSNGKQLLGYFDLSSSSPTFTNSNVNHLKNIVPLWLFIENNNLVQWIDKLNQNICINNLNDKLHPVNQNTYQLTPNGWNAIANFWLSTTNIGEGVNQSPNYYYPSINSKNELIEFIKTINWTNPSLIIRQDLPSQITINPNYWLETIAPSYGSSFKLSFVCSYPDKFSMLAMNNISYRWFHNDQLVQESSEPTIYIHNLNNENEITNKLVGTWKCLAYDKIAQTTISSRTLTITIDNNYSATTFYPYYLSMIETSNSNFNPNLELKTNSELLLLPHQVAQYEIWFKNQICYSQTITSSQTINFTKQYALMKNEEFGEYQLKITIKNINNEQDQVTWNSPIYYAFKFA